MANIAKIMAHEIIDSRGVPTIRAYLGMDTGRYVKAEIPSGKALSRYEPQELRDGDPARYGGQGVQVALRYINDLIAPKLIGASIDRIHEIDQWLIDADGTENRSKLGSNTMLAISLLLLKAGAKDAGVPVYVYINQLYKNRHEEAPVIQNLPAPIVNMINGGSHGSKTLDFQEFHIIPSTSLSFAKALEQSIGVYQNIQHVLEYRNVGTFLSQQGGFTPQLLTNIDACEVIKEAIVKQKLRLGVDIFMGLDCAANNFYKDGKYVVKDMPQPVEASELLALLKKMSDEYHMLVIEDPVYEDSFQDWRAAIELLGKQCYIAGDDLISGNRKRLEMAVNKGSCNTVVIKANHFATITELIDVIPLLKKQKIKIVLSQRYGETNDTVLADIAVGLQADFVKFGSPNRGERVAKYNRLLEIDHTMKIQAGETPVEPSET